jgi:hypothetical protein
MNEINRLKKCCDGSSDNRSGKEMDELGTGPAGGKHILIHYVTQGSTSAATGGPRAYLAISWRRSGAEVHFASRDHRFPTPQLTTRHLRQPNQRRKAALPLRNWQPNPAKCLRRACNRAAQGGGGHCRGPSEGPRPKTALGIFSLMHPSPTPLEKNVPRHKQPSEHSDRPSVHPLHRPVIGFNWNHEHQGLHSSVARFTTQIRESSRASRAGGPCR